MATKPTKSRSTWFVSRTTHTNTTTSHHLRAAGQLHGTPNGNKRWRAAGGTGTPAHCWWRCWNGAAAVETTPVGLPETKHKITTWPLTLSLVSTQEKRTRMSKQVSPVFSSITHNTRKTEAKCGLAIPCKTKRDRAHHQHSQLELRRPLKCDLWWRGLKIEKLAPSHRAYSI